MPREVDSNVEVGNADKPQTPASEPASSQPASPVKKRRKASRSHSIPAQSTTIPEYHHPVYHHDGMIPHSPFNEMHPPMGSPIPMGPMGHGGQQPAGLYQHTHSGQPLGHHQHPHMTLGIPQHVPPHPASMGHMVPQPQQYHPQASPAGRFMRPGPVPPPHMHPGPPHMHSQAMAHHMGGGMNPMSHGGPGSFPGMESSPRIYPANQSTIYNPNAPPSFPCGSCHKEVHDSDQAILCESGCNFWFHRHCSGLTEHAYLLLTKEVFAEWACDQCIQKKNIPLIKVKP